MVRVTEGAENMKVRCDICGNDKFTVEDESARFQYELVIVLKCIKCGSLTVKEYIE